MAWQLLSIPKTKTIVLLIDKKDAEQRIMIIDDEADTLLAFKQILEDDGFRVDTFEDPLMALSAFKASKENDYQLLLIDLNYNQYDINAFNGFKVHEEMKKSGKKMPPVCFITAFQNLYDMLRQSIPEVSVECFIKKPIEGRDLVAKLRQEISGSA